MEQIRVLVTDPFEKEGVEILKKAGFAVDEVGKLAPDKLCELIPEYDAVVVRSGTKVTAEAIRRGARLKIVGRAGVGLDNVDIAEATACGVIVMNSPEGNTVSAAEHTIGMLFALARKIPQASASMKRGEWEKKKFMGTELYGKTLGVIGLGRIGRRVAAVAAAVGMKVLGYDPNVTPEWAKNLDLSLVSLEGLCRQADFITLHIPLTDETRHILGAREFDLMKSGVRLVNVSRGGTVDEQALVANLENGKVAGAALDVFEQEPPSAGCPLLCRDEVVATPHLGASTLEAQEKVAVELAGQIVDAFTRNVVRNAANLPTLDEATMEKLRGYLSLGEKLGSLLSQRIDGDIREIAVQYSGEMIHYDLSLLRSTILKGLLQKEGKVSLVNAPLLVKQKGIALKEKRSEAGGEFLNLITVEVKAGEKVSAAGTLIQNDEERIVKMDDFSVEAVPRGFLLICRNEDKPGIMGHIGKVLGDRGINIASMTLGRKKKGGPAITVLNLDEGIDEQVIAEIERFPVFQSVRLVKL